MPGTARKIRGGRLNNQERQASKEKKETEIGSDKCARHTWTREEQTGDDPIGSHRSVRSTVVSVVSRA